jgi:hypothetical protein
MVGSGLYAGAVASHPGADRPEPPATGLCDSCVHQRVVANTRGSRFSLCMLSRSDPRFPRYPRLPVERCEGYEPSRRSGALGPDTDQIA